MYDYLDRAPRTSITRTALLSVLKLIHTCIICVEMFLYTVVGLVTEIGKLILESEKEERKGKLTQLHGSLTAAVVTALSGNPHTADLKACSPCSLLFSF